MPLHVPRPIHDGALLSSLVVALTVGCSDEGPHGPPPTPFVPTEATEAYCGDDVVEIEARIDGLLTALSLEEKVSMMHGAGADAATGLWPVAGHEGLGIPGLHMIDGPRGISKVTQQDATAFPVAMARGATWDPALEERVGEAMGVEARAVGADVLLAPTLNVLRHPRWGRAQETYGEDPVHLGAMGVAFIRGVQEHVIASAKHYAANSIEDTRFTVDVTMDERTLREIYLPHFRRAVQEAQVGSVMSAYNLVNGHYCGENEHLLREILKQEWSFQGFVESDWVMGTHSTTPSALAGLDIEMPTGIFYGPDLVDAVQTGQVPAGVIDEAVRRILRAQLCFGLDADPPVADPTKLVTAEHAALALEVAQRSMVLLKNEGELLPLDRGSLTEIVVAGHLADVDNIGDTGSSDVQPPYVVTALEGITDRAGAVAVQHVASEVLSPADEALLSAADAVIVVTGLSADDEGEALLGAGDREMLDLPADRVSLLQRVAQLNPATIVVLEGGAAITMSSWLDDVPAVLMAWYPGLEGGHAIGDLIFGEIAPSGRLPLSIPAEEADLPAFDNLSDSVTYDRSHGYRYLDHQGTAAQFPFGFGLSYTTFHHDSLQLEAAELGVEDTLTAHVEVTNSGARTAIETVQLYVSPQDSAVDRALKDLRGFAQVEVIAGATETVTLELPVRDLAYYDVEARAWVVEPGTYLVQVGPSCQDLPLSATVVVGGP